MPTAIATLVYAFAIWGLFWLDRDEESRTSKALWIPVLWLWIVGSRPVSLWLQMTPPVSADQYLEGSPLDRLVFMGLLAVGLVVLVTRSGSVGRLLRRNGPILLFYLYCAVSMLWSDYPEVAFKRWIKSAGDLVMVLVVLSDLAPSVAVKRVLTRVGFVLVPLSVLLIKYYADLGRAYARWTWTQIYTGVATDKNQLGMISMLFGLGAAWRLCGLIRDRGHAQRRRHLVAQAALLSMSLWLLWTANSVTSIACFVMGSMFIAATRLSSRRRTSAFLHILVLATVLVSSFAVFISPENSLIQSLGRDPTLTGRTKIWAQVIALNTNPLLGTGFESFWLGERLQKLWNIYWWHPNEAHNGYLEVFLNLGWIGLALLALLLVTGYRNVVAAFCNDPETGSIRLAFFIAAVLYNFTESAIRMLNPIWIFFLLATTAVPTALLPEAVPPVGVEHTNSLAECAPPLRPLSVGLPGKDI